MSDFTFSRRDGDKISTSSDLGKILQYENPEREHWLFIVPHDDDAVIGAGLLFQKAKAENIALTILITTDGHMGYCSIDQKEQIIDIRKQETLNSFKLLGIEDVQWLNFPDCSLPLHMGRRAAKAGDPCVIENCTGLQNAYTYHLRKLKPTKVFLASHQDYHPDHKIVYEEVLISLFHANGSCWPELGRAIEKIPAVYEMAIYCDFSELPNIKLEGQDAHLEKKVEAILAYQSQTQIGALVDQVREGGSVEYFRDIEFKFYSPKNYQDLF